jgi:hypothetical protein
MGLSDRSRCKADDDAGFAQPFRRLTRRLQSFTHNDRPEPPGLHGVSVPPVPPLCERNAAALVPAIRPAPREWRRSRVAKSTVSATLDLSADASGGGAQSEGRTPPSCGSSPTSAHPFESSDLFSLRLASRPSCLHIAVCLAGPNHLRVIALATWLDAKSCLVTRTVHIAPGSKRAELVRSHLRTSRRNVGRGRVEARHSGQQQRQHRGAASSANRFEATHECSINKATLPGRCNGSASRLHASPAPLFFLRIHRQAGTSAKVSP